MSLLLLFRSGGYTQNCSGSVTPSGALVKQTSKVAVGSTTATGALLKATSRALAGSVTATGALVKLFAKLLTGSVTPSGALEALKVIFKTLVGSCTPSGSLVKMTQKALTGSVTGTGSLVRQFAKVLTGSVTAVGTLITNYLYGGVNIFLNGIAAAIRITGLTITDALNDAPNTCTLRVESPVPQTNQSLEVNVGLTPLFSGALQTVGMAYDLKGTNLVYPCTAIDDTAKANMKRPLGSWTNVSATVVGQSLVADFAPAFDDAGIVADLPEVSITFDGSETFIACFARMAKLIGGYCKVEEDTVFLFLTDATDLPDDITDANLPLNDPPITRTVDASQLRTRVYGKGYGENVPTDVDAGETIIPLVDGAQFTTSGGKAITGTEPEEAQYQVIDYTGVVLPTGGTLVGPGAQPPNAPTLALAAGAGVTSGVHDVGVVFVTAAGKSLIGPAASLDVGLLGVPGTAPTANTATTGTGPDQGSHDYQVTNVGLGGETTPSPASNAITTSAAVGQLTAPGAAVASNAGSHAGNVEVGLHRYKLTFRNATGETEAGTQFDVTTNTVTPPTWLGCVGSTGGSLTLLKRYLYVVTFYTAYGETNGLVAGSSSGTWFWDLTGSEQTITLTAATGGTGVPISSDPNVIGRKVYRHEDNGGTWPTGPFYLVATIANNSGTTHVDTMAQATASSNPARTDFFTSPINTAFPATIPITSIPLGGTGATSRRLYRTVEGGSGDYKLVATINDNVTTTYNDTTADASLGAVAPSSNTTGTAVQVIPVTSIPLGPAGTTSRKLYRRFNATGTFKLVATIGNNTATSYSDSTPNSGLGANAPSTNTAAGNQIALSSVPVGAAAVTAREIYMSPAGGGTKRLCLTISDNSTTTGTITMSDATLAGQAAAPGSDTSGLAQPAGQINPNATEIPLASSAPFLATYPAGSGWAQLNNQTVRFTGISGQSLTGIPPTGPGSIATAILYGSQALPAPALTGVTGLVVAMARGSAVKIWVQRDDVAAQAAEIVRSGGGDGIIEYTISDERRNEASLTSICDASLALFAYPIITVRYACRDIKTKSGKQITFNLSAPYIVDTLTIQSVTIDQLGTAQGLRPRFTVTASSVRFSLEDTLRRLVAISTAR